MKISKTASRIGALLLAVFMLFGMLPVSAFAAEGDVTYTKVASNATIEDGAIYLIVADYNDKFLALKNDGSNTATAKFEVDVANDTVTAKSSEVSAIEWTAEKTGTKWLFKNNSSNLTRLGSNDNRVSVGTETGTRYQMIYELGTLGNATSSNGNMYLRYGSFTAGGTTAEQFHFVFNQNNPEWNVSLYKKNAVGTGEGGNQGGTTPPVTGETVTYTKIDADKIAVGKKIVIVGNEGSNYYALTNPSQNDTNVTKIEVSPNGNSLSVSTTDAAKILWTVGKAEGVQTSGGKTENNQKYNLSNQGFYLWRYTEKRSNNNNIEHVRANTNPSTKYFGFNVEDTTIGTYSGSDKFYGMYYDTNNDTFRYTDMGNMGQANSSYDNVTFYAEASTPAPCTHTNLNKTNEVPATCTAAGTKAYWTCADCGENFSDEAKQNKIADLTAWKSGEGKIAAGHKYGELIAKVEAQHTSTALVDGKEAHYECSVCHKLFVDEGETKKEVTDAQLKIEAKHEFGTAWDHKVAEGHAHKCSCGANDTIVAHIPGAAATETTPQTCTACGYEMAPATGHVTHSNGVKQDGKAASCTEDGYKDYYKCGGCNALFEEAACTTPIADLAAWKAGDGKIAAGHTYGELIAEVKPVHTQTELKAGTKAHYECSVCEKLFVDKDGAKAEVTAADLVIAAPTHTPGAYINTDANKHWKECSVCGLKSDEANHDFTNGDCVCGAKAPAADEKPTKVTALTAGKYVIVSDNNKKGLTTTVHNGYMNTNNYGYAGFEGKDVTIADNKITSAVSNDMIFEVAVVSGGYTIKNVAKNQYLTASYVENNNGGYTGTVTLSGTAETWEWEASTGRLKSTKASNNTKGSTLFLTFDDKTDTISSGSGSLFGIRSSSNEYTNVDKIDFYKVGEGTTPAPQPKTLESIAVTTQPTKKAYTAGEDFAAAGMVVTATYSDDSTAPVTGYTVTDGEDLTVGKTSVTVSYTEGGVTQTTTVAITVTAASTPDDEEGNPTKVTALKPGKYVIANGTNALTSKVHNGYTNSSSYKYSGFEGKKVTISGNEITDATADMVFELAASGNGYTIKHVDSGKYLNATYVSNGSGWTGALKLDDTTDVWTWDASTGYLKSTNASNQDGSKGLYLVFDDRDNSVSSGNQNNMFGIRSDSNSGSNLDKIDFYLVGKALEDDDDNQGGNQGGTVTPAPEGTTFVAFTSDVHSQVTNTTSGSPARLNNWLNNVSGKIGGTFDTMAFCGDNADGTGSANDDAYWSRVAAVMSVVTNSNKVNGEGIFINGNHEWENGKVGSSTNATAKKIKNIGDTVNEEDYAIYVFGAASSNQSYNTSDITALGNWLKTAPTDKPIFIISHFPIHSAAGRTTGNADTLRTTLNEYADDHDIYFLWGHNHTYANKGEDHYDKVYTGTLDNQTIGFTYLAAGCMSDTEYYDGTGANVKGKGLVAKIVDGKVETLTYYGESGNAVYTYNVDNTPADPDQPGTEDPEDPIVPDEPGKVTTLEDGYYILVSNNNTKALTNTANSGYSNSNGYSYSGFNGADVTISNDKITAGATESMVFEIKAVTGGYTIRNVEKNQYLTATYTQSSSGSGYDGKLFLSNTAETWELDSNFRLKSTNASQNGRNLGLYLTYDDKADSLSTGAANFFGIRSEGENHDFANVDKIDFYKVEVKDEPEQPEQPDHEHTWGEVTYTFAADGKSCTATRACECETTETATATITSSVKTAATCETMGVTTYTATFEETWAETQTKDVQDIPMIAHVYEDGECTACGAEDPAEAGLFELYGANMILGNNLAMNFYIETADLEFGEDYYAVITKDYADGRDDLKITVQDEDWEEFSSSLYRVTMDKIAAKEMADRVTVVIYNDEDEQVSKTWIDSVRDYTMRGIDDQMAEEDINEELMAVYVELLNYGAAAQDAFDYNVDDPANNELTEAHLAYGLDNVQMDDFRVSEGAFVGTSLTLESNILMNFYFSIDPADYKGLEAVATYTDHYGKAHETTFDGDDFSKFNSTTWGITVDTLVVADCREFVTVEVYDADGNLLASATDSVESYAARRGTDDALSIAIMTFAVAAYNNFH